MSFSASPKAITSAGWLTEFENDKQEDKIKFLERKNYEVQDYVITAGKYWTGKTSDVLNLYVAQQLKGVKPQNPNLVYAKILENINTEKFSEKLKKGLYKPHILDAVCCA